MSTAIQTLIVVPDDGRPISHVMSAPVHLVNPDGTPYQKGGGQTVAYMDKPTLNSLRDALIQSGIMSPEGSEPDSEDEE